MMRIESLDDLRLLAESADLECKLAAGKEGRGALPKTLWESYSAMANSDGGTILLGVEQRGESFHLHGITDVERLTKELFDAANNPQRVSVNLLDNRSVRVIELEGVRVLQIEIRRATRQERPVFLKNDALHQSFVRLHECDQRLSVDAVKRMLAEQVEESRDTRMLPGYSIDDLCMDSLQSYRQLFINRQPSHPFNDLIMRDFLDRIGAWRRDRETGEKGLTLAGLLVFGYHHLIQQVLPFYMLDYQERPEAKAELRWVDRLTLDGSWSGNLYDFYRKVYGKLTEGLKVPFALQGDKRLEESPVHVALREALCNAIVHADYSDRCSVLIVKRPDMFGFRNPGMMRIPVSFALAGGHADCRNRTLHQMFRYVGIGDQAGSGVPKIMTSWEKCRWRQPVLEERREPSDQTLLWMRMIDLVPREIVDQLRARFGDAFEAREQLEQMALIIAATERTLTHRRLSQLGNTHPADVSRALHNLVGHSMLEQTGSSRGAVYHLRGESIPGPEDVFGDGAVSTSAMSMHPLHADNQHTTHTSLPNSETSSPNRETSLPNSGGSSQNTEPQNPQFVHDEQGRILSPDLDLPVIQNLDTLSSSLRADLMRAAEMARAKKRMSRDAMQEILLQLTHGHYITINCLAQLLDREAKTLRDQYLNHMRKSGLVRIAFPRSPNDPRQAYTAAD